MVIYTIQDFQNKNTLVFGEVEIFGEAVNCFVDTGANVNSIDKKGFFNHLKKLNFKEEETKSISVGSGQKSNLKTYVVENFVIENNIIDNIEFKEEDFRYELLDSQPYFISIGVMLLKDNKLSMDFKNLKINKIDSRKFKNRYPIFFDKIPYITYEINGQSHNFIIDTGAGISLIDPNLIDTSIFKSKIPKNLIVKDAFEEASQFTKFFQIEFKLIDKLFSNQFLGYDMSFLNNFFKEASNISFTGIIGPDFLVKYKILLDFNDMKLCFK